MQANTSTTTASQSHIPFTRTLSKTPKKKNIKNQHFFSRAQIRNRQQQTSYEWRGSSKRDLLRSKGRSWSRDRIGGLLIRDFFIFHFLLLVLFLWRRCVVHKRHGSRRSSDSLPSTSDGGGGDRASAMGLVDAYYLTQVGMVRTLFDGHRHVHGMVWSWSWSWSWSFGLAFLVIFFRISI